MVSGLVGDHGAIFRERDLQVLILAGAVTPLAVSLISPVFEVLIGTFDATPSTIGLLVSAYTAPSLVLIPLGGALSDRYGRKRVLIAGLLCFGSAGVAISLTTTFEVVLALRALQGVGSAGTTPVVVTAIGDLYSDTEAATAQGLRMTAVGTAQAIFPLAASLLVAVAWQLPFLMYAMALPVAALVYCCFDESLGAETGRGGDHEQSYRRRLSAQLARPRVAALLVAYAGPTFLYFGFQAYVAVMLVRVLDGSAGLAGLVVAVFSVVYAVAATQAGRATARFATRYRPLVGATLVMAGGLSAFALAPTVLIAVAGAVGFGAGYGLSLSLCRSLVPELAPPDLRGGVVSSGETLGRFGATISPAILGTLIGVLSPTTGFAPAVRWSIGAVAAAIGVLMIAAVLLAASLDEAG